MQVAAANLETARLNLSFTEIRSPISGIAGRHLINKGNLIDGGSTNSSLLTTVVPTSPIYVYFEMDEASRLADIRREFKGELPGRENEGLPVEIQLADEKGFPHQGVIDFIDNRLNKNTATITVRGRFENKDKFLTPGLFARVRVPASNEHEAVLIPDASIGTTQSFKYVWVIGADNQARQQEVEPGPLYDGLRIIRSGLNDSDRIVTKGIQLVRPGSPVVVAAEEQLSLPDENTREKSVAIK
jgi:RND family efflux transporter MFP subunit